MNDLIEELRGLTNDWAAEVNGVRSPNALSPQLQHLASLRALITKYEQLIQRKPNPTCTCENCEALRQRK